MNLSKNFELQEFTISDTALRKHIDNKPNSYELINLTLLCTNLMQPIRDKVGRIKVTSGFRSKALNIAINGSLTSQHSEGKACDFIALDTDMLKTFLWIKDNMEHDQLIWEFGKWIHVSFNLKQNRKQCLEAYLVDGITKYRNYGG